MTWDDRRHQFGRAIRAGLTPDEAKTFMPRCQKCTTQALRAMRHARGSSTGNQGGHRVDS